MIITRNSAVLFDVDGTLVDSMGYWLDTPGRWAESMGIRPETDLYDYYRENGLSACCHLLADTYPELGGTKAISDSISRSLFREYRDEMPAVPHALDFLRKLRSHGVPLYVFTANLRELVLPALERLGMAGCFEKIILTPEYPEADKRKISGYEAALDMLGLEKGNCTMFEDQGWSAASAAAAGLGAVGIVTPATVAQKPKLLEVCSQVVEDYDCVEVVFDGC